VVLDGNAFIGCHFVDCTLVYGGGTPPTLVGGSFLRCSWVFEGPAANTLAFMRGLHAAEGGLRKVILDTFGGLDGAATTAPVRPAIGQRHKRSRANGGLPRGR
jgi:hypothetical protein